MILNKHYYICEYIIIYFEKLGLNTFVFSSTETMSILD
jgi:hypothetical protein